MVRVDADFSATPFKAKISNAEQLRVHTMLVIGGRDMEAGAVSVRLHHGGPQGANPNHHRVILALSTAFWDAYLRGDAAALAWLNGDGPRRVMQAQDQWQFSAH
jgi:hypothetical protein